MACFKVRATPRLQLITSRITGPFSKAVRAEPPVAESGAASGTERTTVHRREQGWKQITNETIPGRLPTHSQR